MTLLEYFQAEVLILAKRIKYEKRVSSQALRHALKLLAIARVDTGLPKDLIAAIQEVSASYSHLGGDSGPMAIFRYIYPNKEQKVA